MVSDQKDEGVLRVESHISQDFVKAVPAVEKQDYSGAHEVSADLSDIHI
jgi:hypothetical protein